MPAQTKSPKKQNAGQFLEQKILFHRNRAKKNTFKIVCKMQCLKNDL